MSQPGYLAVGGVEIANNARTAAYLASGIAGPQFEVVSDELCPDLTTLAYPLEVCDGLVDASANQLYASPIATWRVPSTGAVPTAANAVWYPAGYVALPHTGGVASGVLLPDAGLVNSTVRVSVDLATTPGGNRSFVVSRCVNAGTANLGFHGAALLWSGGQLTLQTARRIPGGGTGTAILFTSWTPTFPTDLWLEVEFTALGWTATVYGSDPAVAGAPVITTGSYGYDTSPTSAWAVATGQTEQAMLSVATETGIFGQAAAAMYLATELVFTEIDVLPNDCDATGSSYPGGGAWPGLYPGQYGTFTSPGNDNAPWFDADRAASYGYLGLLVTSIDGLDTTETRSMSQNASGIGGILGPQTLAPRELRVSGYVLATEPSAMQYARRWLAQALAGALCPGCEGAYADVLLTCGSDSDDADLWRIYDAGLTNLVFDLSDAETCDYVTPVSFTIAAADPYLYKLPELEVAETVLNADGSDATLVTFEAWLYGTETAVCVDVAAPDVGITAPIFVFDGGASGIEGGLVYRDQGHYPSASMFPDECSYPATGDTQWDPTTCPFSFSVSIGPGETFVVDNARRRLDWYLSDGTLLNGAPQLNLAAGEVIQWIDTCDGAALRACAVAYSGCTCDDTASVTIYSQHRER